jgi:hypothetical protein
MVTTFVIVGGPLEAREESRARIFCRRLSLNTRRVAKKSESGISSGWGETPGEISL